MVHVIYIPRPKSSVTKGLSERTARKFFVKHGFEVWRGNYLSYRLGKYLEFNQNKYKRLENHIFRLVGGKKYWQLCLWIKAHAGITDFIVAKGDQLFFVEVKLEEESIKNNQFEALKFIENLGLTPMICRVSNKNTVFTKELDLKTRRARPKYYMPKLNSRIFTRKSVR
jgi:hypothetical protein